jgi:hypothetical protein
MVAELNILSEWIPEQMQPGSLFVLENAGEMGGEGMRNAGSGNPAADQWRDARDLRF